MTRREMRKLRDVVLTVVVIVFGVILLVCNFLKIAPGMDTALTQIITLQIAYGRLLGVIYIMLGLAGFIETIMNY